MTEDSLEALKSRLSALIPDEALFDSPESAKPLAPVSKPKVQRRKWTDRDYEMRGLRPRGPRASFHVNLLPDVVELAWALAAESKTPLGAWVEKLILAEAERHASA